MPKLKSIASRRVSPWLLILGLLLLGLAFGIALKWSGSTKAINEANPDTTADGRPLAADSALSKPRAERFSPEVSAASAASVPSLGDPEEETLPETADESATTSPQATPKPTAATAPLKPAPCLFEGIPAESGSKVDRGQPCSVIRQYCDQLKNFGFAATNSPNGPPGPLVPQPVGPPVCDTLSS